MRCTPGAVPGWAGPGRLPDFPVAGCPASQNAMPWAGPGRAAPAGFPAAPQSAQPRSARAGAASWRRRSRLPAAAPAPGHRLSQKVLLHNVFVLPRTPEPRRRTVGHPSLHAASLDRRTIDVGLQAAAPVTLLCSAVPRQVHIHRVCIRIACLKVAAQGRHIRSAAAEASQSSHVD